MNDELDTGQELTSTTWAAFGDLMSAMLAAFVLILLGVIGVQLQLSARLQKEVAQHQQDVKAHAATEQSLKQALAGQLATGRITLVDGHIGISGSVLFKLDSDQLQPEGVDVLKSLAAPLASYLRTHDDILMVSGFTDDQPVHQSNHRFADNWDLSAQRALTVTRALMDAGVPAASVFAAAFGPEQPVAANNSEAGRSKNRRVEIVPVARSQGHD